MAAIHELLKQIPDTALRARVEQEFNRATKNKKFGLVFEEHMPECTPLYGVPVKRGATVSKKSGAINDIYKVGKIDGENAICLHSATGVTEIIALNELVPVAQFGEAIFPTLQPVDVAQNAADSDIWHTLIEADNYHALQLLEYLYPKQVDCIYIDPPYNTGARDWKYNNDYVDSSDSWRHSKWLSMMQKRLKIARRILNPDTGVLIVTIDEHEVHHLRVLLQEFFPTFYIQMVTSVINPKGVTQGRFSRVEEYLIYCFAPNAFVDDSDDNLLNPPNLLRKPRWKGLLRSGTDALRRDRESMFYPVLIDTALKKVVSAKEHLPLPSMPDLEATINGYAVAWPVRKDGSMGRWSVGNETLNTLIDKGYVACGRYDEKRKTWGISYISQPNQQKIDTGAIVITGRNEETNVVEIEYASDDTRVIKTVWHRSYHDAGAYGTDLLTSIIGQSRSFSFPKSLYSEKDALNAILRNKSDALVVDFFAGSGTTLNAVNLLNAEDGGSRRCIIVTNNEVSEAEGKNLRETGYQPGDQEWEKHGICQSVTWPRTKYTVNGKRDDGSILDGEYYTSLVKEVSSPRTIKKLDFVTAEMLSSPAKKKQLVSLLGKDKLAQSLVKADSAFIVSEKYPVSILFDDSALEQWIDALDEQDHIREFYIVTSNNRIYNDAKAKIQDLLGDYVTQEQVKRPMSMGFPANVEYFRLGFLDKNSVSLGQQFKEILPLLWLKSGAAGKRPNITVDEPEMLILPDNRFAVLVDEAQYASFAEQIAANSDIDTVYFVTNSDTAFREMSNGIDVNHTYQLYRNYIDNFVLGSRRDL